MSYFEWRPYVPVAQRRAQAERELAQRRKRGGGAPAPVRIAGRKITTTVWGTAWCENLERYSDLANRLPRGRTYVRNGSVVDLQLAAGKVTALVSGSALYDVKVTVEAVASARWSALRRECAGGIDSLVELLRGTLSDRTMQRICAPRTGLFPEPRELSFSCSCPDWAAMCKHVAAVLYGIGARLDHKPELLFALRGVDAADLIAGAGNGIELKGGKPGGAKILGAGGLAELFGIDLAAEPQATSRAKRAAGARTTAAPGSPDRAKSAPPKPTARAKSAQPRSAVPRATSASTPRDAAVSRPAAAAAKAAVPRATSASTPRGAAVSRPAAAAAKAAVSRPAGAAAAVSRPAAAASSARAMPAAALARPASRRAKRSRKR